MDPIEGMALRYLARRDRTEAQVRALLRQKGVSVSDRDLVIQRLRDQGYVDDLAYALRQVEGWLCRRPMGRARIERELLRRGIDRSTAHQAVDQLVGDQGELELACRLLDRRSGRRKQASLAEKARLLRYYGFAEDTIEKITGKDVAAVEWLD
ncbi:MAG: regulatory protein RecX [bacterium]